MESATYDQSVPYGNAQKTTTSQNVSSKKGNEKTKTEQKKPHTLCLEIETVKLILGDLA